METILKNIAIPAGEGRSTEPLPGETVILKALSADTDGAYTLVEVINEPQLGPPLHIHWHEDVANTTENTIAPTQHQTPTVLQQMSDAINSHDVDAFVSCLTHDYKGEQPLHPEIAPIGLAQVRENWTGLFAQVPDLRATLVASTIDGDIAWAEWHWQGTRTSGSALNLRGVSVTGLRNGIMAWARIYMEPIHN